MTHTEYRYRPNHHHQDIVVPFYTLFLILFSNFFSLFLYYLLIRTFYNFFLYRHFLLDFFLNIHFLYSIFLYLTQKINFIGIFTQ